MIGVRNTTKIASINLDIRKNNAVNNDPIVLRQGDSDVIIEASISNDGYPDLGINFATFVAKKPDGTIISNDPANVNGNTISYPISKHLTESAGKIQDAYFMINNEVTTNGFDISIIPSTQLDDTSVNYIPGIENINKFLESAEADWLGRIQQMKTQIDGLNIPDEFKLLMDKALSDAKAQYQPAIDAAEQNVENIVADLAAKKLDLTNNSDQLNQTITTIKAQVASINSFLDSIQKQIIDANSSFTTDQQNKVSQSIASMQNNLNTAMAKAIADTNASIQQIQQRANDINDSIHNLQIGGRNLLPGTSGKVQTVTNASGYNNNLPSITPVVIKIDSDTTYIAKVWLSPASHDMALQVAWKDSSGTTNYPGGNVISAGTSGYSTWTGTITAGSTIQYVTTVFTVYESASSTVSYKEMKLEKGSVATDWTPAPEDKADDSKVVELQTQVDNSAVGTNLLIGTSPSEHSYTGDFSTIPGWDNNKNPINLSVVNVGSTYTYSVYLTKLTGSFILGYWAYDSDKNYTSWVSSGAYSSAGKASWTFTVPSGVSYIAPHVVHASDDFTCTAKGEKLEKGSVATDWCPNPTEILTQSDYAKIKAAIVALKGSLS